MKNIISEELDYMKYLLGYSKGVVISEQTKTGCIKGNCENGKGTYKFTNGNEYTGQWKDGERNGQGTLKYSDGDEYTGQWEDGKKNGQGTFKWSDGSIVFVGQWKDGRRDGEGTIKYSDGRVIEGQFQGINGPTGQGTYTNKNGVKSSGVWVNDKLDGKSRQELDKLTQSNQTKTTGCIKGNCENGSGTYKMEDGAEYTGEFKDGNFNGQGTFKYTDGSVYVGQFKDDKFNGSGVYKNSAGGVYRGQWKDDKRNGQGTYITSKGVKFSGVWVDGKLDGKSATDLEKVTKSNQTKTECKQPTEPTYKYKDDKNYQYAKSGDCWWAKNINNNKWFNLTELVKTKPNIQISIDRLNDGTNLIKL